MKNNQSQLVVDRVFNEIKEFVQQREKIEIENFMIAKFRDWIEKTPSKIVLSTVDFHNRYHFWGKLDLKSNDISLIHQRSAILKDAWESIEKMYSRLEDYRSKHVLNMILKNWLTFSYDDISKVKENCFTSYFDMDLLMCDENEVFVDLGAWRGDTVDDYRYTYGENCYKRIYCYEIESDNIEKLYERFDSIPNIVIRPVGVSKEKGVMYLSDNGTSDAQSLVSFGSKKVDTVALDQDITEKITFLKTDIEGAEQDAIYGAQEHIRNDKPKLAISIYHSNKDLFSIFELIDRIQPGYHFYLRYNGRAYFPTDYILIGLPPEESKRLENLSYN